MAGRPSKYKPEYSEQAYKLCLLGATDIQLADFFGVSEQTLNTWKTKHPEFLESLKDGKDKADSVIAESLFHRAKGYSHPDTHISNYQGEITVTQITKHYPPDATSCIFWLKNRQKEKWRDTQNIEKKEDITITVRADELTDDQLANIATGGGVKASGAQESKGKPH